MSKIDVLIITSLSLQDSFLILYSRLQKACVLGATDHG